MLRVKQKRIHKMPVVGHANFAFVVGILCRHQGPFFSGKIIQVDKSHSPIVEQTRSGGFERNQFQTAVAFVRTDSSKQFCDIGCRTLENL